jgi:CRISPR-associated protein Csb2
MLVVHVELLHGTIRAGSPDDLAVTGRADPGEWPPSPARLFAALVAADGTRETMRVTDGRELRLLERASPPVILADRDEDALTSHQLGRFVVLNERKGGHTQGYVARGNTLVRPAPRRSPRTPVVSYLWPDLDPTDAELRGLRLRAARVGYLGCADSPVRIRVAVDQVPADESRPRWEPDERGSAHLPVPFLGLLDILDALHDDFRTGLVPRRSWYRSERAAYRAPGRNDAPARAAPSLVWLRFDRTTTGRHALQVTEALRAATLGAFENLVAGSRDGVPQILHGHGFDGVGYDHVSWLVLPDVGHRHATGRLHGAAVALPPDASPELVESVRRALWHVRALHLPGGRELRVDAYRGQARPWAAHPGRWTGPARRWVSALPVVHERWSKRPPGRAEVERWCQNAGVSATVRSARLSRPPLLSGAVALMPHETSRRDGERRPYSHLEVEFDEDVHGPVVLGRLRHFGLGLMAPLHAAPPPARRGSRS